MCKKGTRVRYWWACKFVQPLWKTVSRFLKKSKIELSYDPEILLLGIYPSKMKNYFKTHMYPHVH